MRSAEYLSIAYFALSAVRCSINHRLLFGLLDVLVCVLFFALPIGQRRWPNVGIGFLRDWAPLALLFFAYWNIDQVARIRQGSGYEQQWVRIDRLLLDRLGGRNAIERWGATLPWLLELAYLGFYLLPPALLMAIYRSGKRRNSETFLFTLLAGSLTTYALMPLFPSQTPRVAFAGQDLPPVTAIRLVNVWLLDSFDVRASVFPSGHVTVAFSSAFGAMAAMPNRLWLGSISLAFSVVVWIGTVYGRYHYAVDGMAAFTISFMAYYLARIVHPVRCESR